MATTEFKSLVSAQGVGSEDVQALAAAFAGLEGAIDRASKKGDNLNQHRGFGEFAEKVRQGIENPLQAIGGAAEDVLKRLGPVGSAVAGTSAVLGAASVAGLGFARDLAQLGDQIDDTAARMGMTVRETGEMRIAMHYAGGAMEALEGITHKLSEEIERGSPNLRALGINVRDAATGGVRMGDVVLQLSDRLRAMESVTERNALAVKILGKGAMEVLPDLMELSQVIDRARESGLAPAEADTARWGLMAKQIAEIDERIEAMKRRLKEPLAATVLVTFRWAGLAAGAALGLQDSLTQFALGGTPTGKDLEMAQSGGGGFARAIADGVFLGGDSDSRAARAAERRLIARNDAAVDAALAVTDEEKLGRLREQLKQYQGELKKGVFPDVNDPTLAKINSVREEIAAVEAQVKATKDLEAAKRSLEAWERQNAQRELGPAAGAFVKRDELVAGGVDWDEATGAALREAIPELAKGWAAVDKQTREVWAKSREYFEEEHRNFWKPIVEDANARAADAGQAFIDYAKKVRDAAGELRKIDVDLQRSEASADSSRRMGFANLHFGPGREVEAVNAFYAERVRLAAEVYAIDFNGAETLVEQAQALAALKRDMRDAEVEHTLRLVDLERQRIDRWRAFSVDAVRALRGGDLGGFARAQFEGFADRVIGNVAEMGWGSVSKMIPHASAGSFWGQLLAGTSFGPDPMHSAGVRLETAGDRLHIAATDLMAAARAQAASPSGGGGGVLPGLPGGRFASRLLDELFGGQGGSGEGGDREGDFGDWLDWLGKNGENGDYADESSNPANRQKSWKSFALAGMGFAGGLYGTVTSPSTKGKLASGGALLGGAGMFVPGPAGWALLGAGAALEVVSMFFPDPKARRGREIDEELTAAQYRAPEATTYTMDRYGRSFDYNIAGQARPIVNVTVNALDSRSFEERVPMIIEKVTDAIESKMHPRFEASVRRIAFRG